MLEQAFPEKVMTKRPKSSLNCLSRAKSLSKRNKTTRNVKNTRRKCPNLGESDEKGPKTAMARLTMKKFIENDVSKSSYFCSILGHFLGKSGLNGDRRG